MRPNLTLAVASALLLARTAAGAAAPDATTGGAKLRVLVVTGGHAFNREAFAAMFDAFDGIEWREAQHPNAYGMFAPDQRQTYDVIALYDMARTINEAQRPALLETIKQGKGLLVLHHALADNQDWPEWVEVVGGRYFTAPQQLGGKEWIRSTFKHDANLTVEIADPQHPITKGLSDFSITDEAYANYYVSPKAHPLLKVHHPDSAEIVGWTRQYGATRVVCLAGGHGPTAYKDPNFRALVSRSLLWVGGRL